MSPIFAIVFYILAMMMGVVVFAMTITAKPFLKLVLLTISKLGGIYVIAYAAIMLAKIAKII